MNSVQNSSQLKFTSQGFECIDPLSQNSKITFLNISFFTKSIQVNELDSTFFELLQELFLNVNPRFCKKRKNPLYQILFCILCSALQNLKFQCDIMNEHLFQTFCLNQIVLKKKSNLISITTMKQVKNLRLNRDGVSFLVRFFSDGGGT